MHFTFQGDLASRSEVRDLLQNLLSQAYRFRALCPSQADLGVSFGEDYFMPRDYVNLTVDNVRMQNTLRFGIQVQKMIFLRIILTFPYLNLAYQCTANRNYKAMVLITKQWCCLEIILVLIQIQIISGFGIVTKVCDCFSKWRPTQYLFL